MKDSEKDISKKIQDKNREYVLEDVDDLIFRNEPVKKHSER